MPKPEDAGADPLPPESWRQVRAASAILRLAEGLDRSHYAAVRDLRVIGRGGRLTIELATQNDAALELWETRRRTELLGKLLGADVAVRVARSRRKPSPKKRGRR